MQNFYIIYNKPYFAENNITVYTINATKIAQEIGLGRSASRRVTLA
jgi:hypothetical protein